MAEKLVRITAWITLLGFHSLAPVSCEDAPEVLFDRSETLQEGQRPGGGTERGLNNTYMKDITHFVGGVNGWDFSGMWGKYDLANLDESARPIPINPERPDQAVFICHTSTLPGMLEKKFPPLERVNLTLSYYLSSRDMDISMRGIVMTEGRIEPIFSYSEPADTHEHNDTWVIQHFRLPDLTKEGEFTIQFILQSFDAESVRSLTNVWATDEIIVEGFKVTSLPIVGTGEPEPEGGTTTSKPDINTANPGPANVTTFVNATNVGVNVTTVASNVTVGTNETTGIVIVNGTSNGTDGITSGTNGTYVGTNSTEQPEGGGNGSSSSLYDRNVTVPIRNMSADFPSTVQQRPLFSTSGISLASNITQIPPVVSLNTSNNPVSVSFGIPHLNNSDLGPNITLASGNSNVNDTGNNISYAGIITSLKPGAPAVNDSGYPSDNSTQESPQYNISGAPPSNVSQETPANASIIPPPPSIGDPDDYPEDTPGEDSPIRQDFSDAAVNKLEEVAKAIWDAFYVFLALFCACLIALIGLLVRGRCKDDDNPPPSVATYNPRTASYRLDKVYDNAGYDTNPV